MRSIMQNYITLSAQNKIGNENKTIIKNRFEELRDQLHDETLKEYSSFEFMEKLYEQEYLVNQ